MSRKRYTIFVLPHAHGRFRKVHISKIAAWSGLVLGGLLLAAGLWTPHWLFRLQVASDDVERLSRENRQLAEEKTRFDDRLAEIGQRLNEFEREAVRLAEALGIEDPTTPPAGGGTDAGLALDRQAIFREELDALGARSAGLGTSLEQLSEAWVERERLLGSTPAVVPVEGWFSDGFGWRKDPMNGRREFHRGIDIVAPSGTLVIATADGVVTESGRVAGYGKKIDLYHGYGFRTRYGHLSEILVAVGDRVTRGDPIGRVGSTGRSTGPHLHYEVFKEGRRVNPWRYLGDAR